MSLKQNDDFLETWREAQQEDLFDADKFVKIQIASNMMHGDNRVNLRYYITINELMRN